MNPIPLLNLAIELLTILGIGIRTTRTVINEFKTLFPQFEGISVAELIDRYEARLGISRAKIEAMLNEE